MRLMKDSGLIWIGEIPENWEVIRLKDKYKFVTGFTPDTKRADYYNDEDGYEWVTISDINNGEITCPTKSLISREYVRSTFKKQIPKGCLLYSFKLSVGQTAITDRELFTNEALAAFIPTPEININFLKYSSSLIEFGANTNIYGAKILNQQLINDAYIVFPPLSEQKRIADFLDYRCKKIDNLYSDIERQISILDEYKKAVITKAVTKGLHADVPMKDSYIEWIGEIPEEWDIKPFGYILKERNEKNVPVKTEERLSLSIDKGITLYAEKTTNLDRFKDDVSQYKIAHEGDFVMNSMNMIVGAFDVSAYYGCVSPAYYTFYDETENHIQARFCNYYFKMKPMMKVLFSMGKGIMAIDRGEDRVNTCRLKVSRYDLNKIPVCTPSLSVQKEIVEYLDKICGMIDNIILEKNNQLETLSEYKKSVIYEYVTGKKEVPSNA